MAAEGLASVSLSITTLDRSLARTMEPRAAAPERRLDALRGLSEAGIPTGVLAAPMIPGLNDHELEKILEAAAAAGARRAGYVLLRLPHELKELFTDWLQARYPAKAGRDMRTISVSVFGAPGDQMLLDTYRDIGATRVILRLPSEGRDKILPMLDQFAKFLR